MRKHRKYERVSNKVITVQCKCLSPRDLMSMIAEDIEVEVKARKGTYGNGSEDFPIPRTMNIARLADMSTPSSVKNTSAQETQQTQETQETE